MGEHVCGGGEQSVGGGQVELPVVVGVYSWLESGSGGAPGVTPGVAVSHRRSPYIMEGATPFTFE
jgi:hypothetical protein